MCKLEKIIPVKSIELEFKLNEDSKLDISCCFCAQKENEEPHFHFVNIYSYQELPKSIDSILLLCRAEAEKLMLPKEETIFTI